MICTRRCEHDSKWQRGACIRVHHATTRQPACGTTRRCELFVSLQKALEPMEQLPPEYIVPSKLKKPCLRPPRLHYGLDISPNALCNYAIKHHLFSAQLLNDGTARYGGMLDAVEHLQQLCGVKLSLQALLWTAEETWMISRYTNYTPSIYMKMGPSDEEIFAVICRELAITATPKWYQVV